MSPSRSATAARSRSPIERKTASQRRRRSDRTAPAEGAQSAAHLALQATRPAKMTACPQEAHSDGGAQRPRQLKAQGQCGPAATAGRSVAATVPLLTTQTALTRVNAEKRVEAQGGRDGGRKGRSCRGGRTAPRSARKWEGSGCSSSCRRGISCKQQWRSVKVLSSSATGWRAAGGRSGTEKKTKFIFYLQKSVGAKHLS